jgi:hypothetical protein
MIVYMVVEQLEDGRTNIRIGGGSSTPATVRVYESEAKARAFIKNGRNDYNRKRYIHVIDLNKQEIRV